MPRLDCRPCLLLLISTCAIAAAQNDSLEVGPHAQALHDSALVVDTHADTPQRFLERGFDIGSADPHDKGQISLDKVRAGNLGAEFFSIWVDPQTTPPANYAKQAFDLIDSVYQQAAHHPDRA